MQRFVYPMACSLINHAKVGSGIYAGECAAIAQFTLPGNSSPICPHPTADWRRGEKVRSNRSLQRGTLIAIFHPNQAGEWRYVNKKGGIAHTALYVGQSDEGIEVVHQWQGPHPIKGTLIRFGGNKVPGHDSGVSRRNQLFNIVTPEDDADNYYTVTLDAP